MDEFGFDNGLKLHRNQYEYSIWQRAQSRAVGIFRAVEVGALGMDVSAWQPKVNFATAAGQNVKFAIVRASRGLFADTLFAQHWSDAAGHVKRSAYHYYKENNDPKAQAGKFFDTVGPSPDFPPVLDVEDFDNPTLTASRIKTCLEEIEQLFGVRPFFYSNYYIVRDSITGDKSYLSNYPLWIAGYPLAGWQPDYPQRVLNYPPSVPAPFEKWELWQWTAYAPAAQYGVTGSASVDLDYCSPAFYDQYIDPPPIVTDVPVNTTITASHKTNVSGVFYNGASSTDWATGYSEGQLVEVLPTPPQNGRVRVAHIHKRAGIVFAWVREKNLKPLPEPVTLRAIYPSGDG